MTAGGVRPLPPRQVAEVALSLFRRGADTMAERAVKDMRCQAARSSGCPASHSALGTDPVVWLTRLAERLEIPASDRPARQNAAFRAAENALHTAAERGLTLLSWSDTAYPPLLREIPDPPIVLWAKGDPAVLGRPAVAVVGSRNATPTGLQMARRLGRELAGAGLVVVSGLARGIDGAGHRGALDAAGPTIAVLGCGADVVYPREHAELVGRIASSGAVVSELPPGMLPLPHHFPLRNRIISGLSRAVVIVEASERSGSLITARAALEQGRDVLAVPGTVAGGRYQGCHALIRDGARLVETVEDVLDEIAWSRSAAPGARTNSLQLSKLEETMAVGEPYSVDDLVLRTRRATSDILAELATLELAGRIRRLAGGTVVRLDSTDIDG
jgi:DNA processing protein